MGGGGQDLEIEAFLEGLGFDTPAALAAARKAIETDGLTRPGRQRMAAAKAPRAHAALVGALVRSCDRPSCRDALARSGRQVAIVSPSSCERCGGSGARDAAVRLSDVCAARNGCRLVVLGGSPRAREEIVRLGIRNVSVRLVDGTARRTIDGARADARWADVVVVWASTQLDHRVSQLYADAADGKVLVVSRRGVAAMLDEVAERVTRRSREPRFDATARA